MVGSWVSQASFEPPGLTIAVAKDRAIESMMQVCARAVCVVHMSVCARCVSYARVCARVWAGGCTFRVASLPRICPLDTPTPTLNHTAPRMHAHSTARACDTHAQVGDKFVLNCLGESNAEPLMKHFLKRFEAGADRFQVRRVVQARRRCSRARARTLLACRAGAHACAHGAHAAPPPAHTHPDTPSRAPTLHTAPHHAANDDARADTPGCGVVPVHRQWLPRAQGCHRVHRVHVSVCVCVCECVCPACCLVHVPAGACRAMPRCSS
jgi:flavin reductase (DIM6/NTAB) family NADH-FMN oxidoreductase RutF